jgi:hypothetical protein
MPLKSSQKAIFRDGNPSQGNHHLVVEAILAVLASKNPVNFSI